MKRWLWMAMLVMAGAGWAAAAGATEALSEGDQILAKIDQVMNAPPDKTAVLQIILQDSRQQRKERRLSLWEKQGLRRLVKFLAPADQKGIGFLSLPNDRMYLYLPAFKKTRRIAAHVKSGKFAGTDFTYEDMEAREYAGKWNARVVSKDGGQALLELTLKPGQTSDYGKMLMTVRLDVPYPVKAEYFDQGLNPSKIMRLSGIQQTQGYWEAWVKEMTDLKSGHVTRMSIETLAFDQGLSDSLFTESRLAR